MLEDDAPLDFDAEDRLLQSLASKKRRKVIGLDDLLADYYTEKSRAVAKDSKRGKVPRCYISDEDEDRTRNSKEKLLSKFVDDCQKQVREMTTEDEVPSWGQNIFGNQKQLPSLFFPELQNCELLRATMDNELNSWVELNTENGERFVEGLIINGWLAKLVFACGHLEGPLAAWTFKLMLYSPNLQLQTSACDLWLAILCRMDLAAKHSIEYRWLPTYNEFRNALDVYGYLPDSSSNGSDTSLGSGLDGPPQNITSWIKCVAACCRFRQIQAIFSTTELEHLLCIVIQLSVDRRLEGIWIIADECMTSLINSFTDVEWTTSAINVANALAERTQADMNCLRLVDCIAGASTRSRQLRSQLAMHVLANCLDAEVTDAEDILKKLLSINAKEKTCDFVKIYIYLILAENWLSSRSLIEQTPMLPAMWENFLRNCSCQITITDWRSFASKARNKASYLLQAVAGRDLQ